MAGSLYTIKMEICPAMTDNKLTRLFAVCFPERRFDPDFPLVLWFVGLWFYLKSFLYICYVYMSGLEAWWYSTWILIETCYFAAALVPVFLMGRALWNEKSWAQGIALMFLIVDTPMLFFHVMRLASAGYLESGLTSILEYGGLGLNLISLGWLVASSMGRKPSTVRK